MFQADKRGALSHRLINTPSLESCWKFLRLSAHGFPAGGEWAFVRLQLSVLEVSIGQSKISERERTVTPESRCTSAALSASVTYGNISGCWTEISA